MKNSNDRPQLRVAVVTPVFNDPERTLKFLKSLKQQVFNSFRTIIVDMGGDNTGELVKHKYPDTIVIKEGDIFWSGGTNAGVRYALERNYEYVFIVNNDVILEKSCLQNLVVFADAHPRSIVGSMVCYQNDPDRVWYFGGYISFNGNMPHAEGRTNDFFAPSETEWLTGMGVLVPTQAYQDIGLYDAEHFPQYLADADFSMRAKKDGGYKLWVIPDARLFFDPESSWFGNRRLKPKLTDTYALLFDVRSPMNLRSRYTFFRRHFTFFRVKYILCNLRYIPSVCLRMILWQVAYVLKQHGRRFYTSRKIRSFFQTSATTMKNRDKCNRVANLPLISIITPVLNSGKLLKKYIATVRKQRYPNIEHIIIDGGSTDDTIKVLQENDSKLDYWASEVDSGIYEAMNKGIDLAHGEWIYFLGVDDRFYRDDTLLAIMKHHEDDDADLIIGNVLYPDGKIFYSRYDKFLFLKNTIHHQGAFYRRRVFDNFRYGQDLVSGSKHNLLISGDYHLNLHLFTRNAKCRYVEEIIAICGRGISMEGRISGYIEEIKIRHRYMHFFPACFVDILTLLRCGYKKLSSRNLH